MKKLTAFLAALVLLGNTGTLPVIDHFADSFAVSAAETSDESVYGDFEYVCYEDRIEITACSREATEIVVPSEIDGMPVTSFATDTDYHPMTAGSSDTFAVQSITIPETVTSVTLAACPKLKDIILTGENPALCVVDGVLFTKDMTTLLDYPAGRDNISYQIPDGVTEIAANAFEDCSTLTSVTIPASVERISDCAFFRCQFETLTLPEGVTAIGDHAFYGCSRLKALTFPASLDSIGNVAFGFCSSLSAITLQEGLRSIGSSAFYSAGLTEVHIPASLAEIGIGAFEHCEDLMQITAAEDSESFSSVDGVLYDKAQTTLVKYPDARTETELIIPDGTTAIAPYAVAYNEWLQSVIIPESVTSMGEGAFWGCSALTSAAILGNVDTLAENLFFDCTSLRRVVLPESVTTVSAEAFLNCAEVLAVYYMGSEAQWNTISITEDGNYGLLNAVMYYDYVYSAEEIQPAEGTLGDLTYLNYGDHIVITGCSTDVTEAVVPPTIDGLMVTEIGEGAFRGCAALTAVVLPHTVTAIHDYAFNGTALEEVYWEGEAYAWHEVTLPGTEDPIHDADHYLNYVRFETTEEYTTGFQNGMAYQKYSDHIEIYQLNYSRSEIVIPAEIEGLPVTSVSGFCDYNPVGGAYYYNYALTDLTIPETVTSINITGCNELETITVDENNPAFCAVDGNLLFSKDKTVLYHYPASRSGSVYTVPDSVTAIGTGAFAGCKKLQEIILPEGLRSIGDSAFIECTNLTDITLPHSLTELGDAFIRCYNLPALEIPAGVTDLSDQSFFFCESLTTLVIPSTVKAISDNRSGFGEPALTDIYYGGTAQEWAALLQTHDNIFVDVPFADVTIHYGFKEFSLADLDGNTEINAADAAMLLKAAAYAGTGTASGLTRAQEAFADLNGDSDFNANDASLLLRYSSYIGTGGTETVEDYLASMNEQ